jgi:hypothetical protein
MVPGLARSMELYVLDEFFSLKTDNKGSLYLVNILFAIKLSSKFLQSSCKNIYNFSAGTPVSSTHKTDYNDKAEILLKVALNTI